MYVHELCIIILIHTYTDMPYAPTDLASLRDRLASNTATVHVPNYQTSRLLLPGFEKNAAAFELEPWNVTSEIP